jgi:hypothetical protein
VFFISLALFVCGGFTGGDQSQKSFQVCFNKIVSKMFTITTKLWRLAVKMPRSSILQNVRYHSSDQTYRGQTFKRYISSPYVPLAIMAGWVSSELALLLKYRTEEGTMESRMRTKKAYLERLIAGAEAGEEIDVQKELLRLHEPDQGLELIMEELEKTDRVYSGLTVAPDQKDEQDSVEEAVPELSQFIRKEPRHIDADDITSARFL